MSSLLDVCHCGHHKDTHFEKAHTCLGVRCDCHGYGDVSKPMPPKASVEKKRVRKSASRPHVDFSCKCTGCLAYDNQGYGI